MKISYGTAAAGGSQQHTGSQLRIAGYGPGAANVVGLTDQTDTFGTISEHARAEPRHGIALSKNAKISRPSPRGRRCRSPSRAGLRRRPTGRYRFGDQTQTVDVIDGTVTATFTAPAATTGVTVTATGVQSGVADDAVAVR